MTSEQQLAKANMDYRDRALELEDFVRRVANWWAGIAVPANTEEEAFKAEAFALINEEAE